jgi:hypothetical protein
MYMYICPGSRKYPGQVFPLATVDLGGSGGDPASPVDPPAPSPPAPLGVTVRGGEPGPSAGGPV